MTNITTAASFFYDADGTPLDQGKVYVGEYNVNPVQSPVSVYADIDLTDEVSQPVETLNGFAIYNGKRITLYVNTDVQQGYSISVANKQGATVFSELKVPRNLNSSSTSIAGYINDAITYSRYGGTLTELKANTEFAYSGGTYNVSVGDTIETQEGYIYEVAASGATDNQIVTASGVKLYARAGGPVAYGAATDGTDTDNDAAFSAWATNNPNEVLDLDGKTWPVTSVPNIPAKNGYWKVTDFEDSLDAILPAPQTTGITAIEIDGGKTVIAWTQDTLSAYGGQAVGLYMPADGHDAGSQDVTCFRVQSSGRNMVDFEPRMDFGNAGLENECFAASLVPPSTSGGAYDGPFQLAAVKDSGDDLNLKYRALAEYEQSSSGGGLDQSETDWADVDFGGNNLGEALRAALDAQYSITTSGVPTVTHAMSLYGASSGANGDVYMGAHSITGASAGPYLFFVDQTPKSGSAAIDFAARIGLLTEGVEPSVAWFQQVTASKLCGFIRSQSASYPLRFWSANGGFDAATIEGATIQDCPFGNDFGTGSPAPCRMRPHRKGSVSGYMATSETLDGTDSDELHFTFTGKRTRDGSAGYVNLYRGVVTKGSGLFENMWSRADIYHVDTLYFSNSNATDTSNQVGVSSMAFLDANTLLISASTMKRAVKGDNDASTTRIYRIPLRDSYADASERRYWDDGTGIPMDIVKAPEYEHYRGQFNSLPTETSATIASGVATIESGYVEITGEGNTADDLDTLVRKGAAWRDGDVVTLRTVSSGYTVTLKDGTGNLDIGADIAMDNARDRVTLVYQSDISKFVELSVGDSA